MSVFPSRVERFRGVVAEEVAAASSPVPVNIALAVIEHESGGRIGVQAYAKAGDGSYARGLMQCIKAVTDSYNTAHGTSIHHDSVMGGEHWSDARLQVRVGLWLLGRKWKQVAEWLQARGVSPELADWARIADTAYAMGWGASKKKLEQLEAEGRPLTFDELAEAFPKWGYSESKAKWINRPILHAEKIWARYLEAEEDAAGGGADPDIDDDPPDEDAGDEDLEHDQVDEEGRDQLPFPPVWGTPEAIAAGAAAVVAALLVVVLCLLRKRCRT